MTHPSHDHRHVSLDAFSRAARFVAAYRAGDAEGARNALHEANREDRLLELAVACGLMAAQLADQVHGDRAQLWLDARALDVGWFRDQELAKLAGSDDDPR